MVVVVVFVLVVVIVVLWLAVIWGGRCLVGGCLVTGSRIGVIRGTWLILLRRSIRSSVAVALPGRGTLGGRICVAHCQKRQHQQRRQGEAHIDVTPVRKRVEDSPC